MSQLDNAPHTGEDDPLSAPDALPTSMWAVAAFTLSLIAWPLLPTIGGYIAVIAVILGHVARREIKQGLRFGNGWAIGGLVIAYWALLMRIATILVVN